MEYRPLSEAAQQLLQENPDLAAEFVNYGALNQREHSVSSKETIDRFTQLYDEMSDFKNTVKSSLERIEACVAGVSEKQQEHYEKYKFFYGFLDKSVKTKESAEWLGSGTYAFLKFVLAVTSVVGGVYLLVKGAWLGFLGISIDALRK